MKRVTDADYCDWSTAYINGKHCSVSRIGVFKWEVRLDNQVRGIFETRSEARARVQELASEGKR